MDKYAPKQVSLAEAIYRDIDQNEYLNELYEDLLYNYSIELRNSAVILDALFR